ncbi:MAG: Coq4 family protein [Limnothrix sp.]
MLTTKTESKKRTKSSQQRWEENLLKSFIEMVKAPNGDFPALNKLSIAARDKGSFQLMIEHLSTAPEAQAAFESFLSMGAIDLDELSELPANTLGYLFAEHMRRNQFNVMVAKQVPDIYHFVLTHIYETHDIWHVIIGADTSFYGEAQIDAFSAAQFKMSRFFHSLVAKNIVKAATYDVEAATPYMDAITKGWVTGRQAKLLFGVDWREWWATPIDEVRDAFHIVGV